MLTEIALTPHAFRPCPVDPGGWAQRLARCYCGCRISAGYAP